MTKYVQGEPGRVLHLGLACVVSVVATKTKTKTKTKTMAAARWRMGRGLQPSGERFELAGGLWL